LIRELPFPLETFFATLVEKALAIFNILFEISRRTYSKLITASILGLKTFMRR
jgi:hypothetical protein